MGNSTRSPVPRRPPYRPDAVDGTVPWTSRRTALWIAASTGLVTARQAAARTMTGTSLLRDGAERFAAIACRAGLRAEAP